ncbi:hypothetical protein MY3957_009798 [Beauveria namnaoensis]
MSSHCSQILYAILNDDAALVRIQVQKDTIHIPPADSWMVYEACLKGPHMIAALASAANIDMNPELPGQKGDRVLHMLLYAPSKHFDCDKAETIIELLKTGIDPFLPGRGRNTAIHILSGGGALAQGSSGHKLLQVLLSRDLPSANLITIIHQTNFAFNTPVIIAAKAHNLPQLQLLLKRGADPNVRGEFGRTALFFAVALNFTDIAETLLNLGADIGADIVALSPEMEATLRNWRD